jgi:[glutamine synthetase] adenylyltransferase / [glutamine synthetase]-adenylyl-L-tyrosine phosphorylase
VTSPEALGRALASAPDPELARVALSRVGERREAREVLADALEPAARLLGFSAAAADFFFAHPEETVLFRDLTERSREALIAEVEAEVNRRGGPTGLRRFRRRALFRLAARDLGGASLDDVVTEMTAIAEACLEVAEGIVGPAVSIIGMGKLGGAELNYSSDVDVVFVHPDGGSGQPVKRAAKLVALLSEPTEEGVALRVDTALRPEGRAGPLSRSFTSTLEYYRRHAAMWERQALLKARPVAGDRQVGNTLLAELTPIVYPDHLEPSAI